MPHQCVKCGKFYDDGSEEILKGCPCGGRLFFYINKKKLEESKNIITDLTAQEKNEIEKDVFDLIGIEGGVEKPVVLDLESIRILKPGKYELDIVNLFRKRPLIYKLEEGKYLIDLPESFKKEEK
jgi:predicted  nucleic acid-binding Zn-ribbon protein